MAAILFIQFRINSELFAREVEQGYQTTPSHSHAWHGAHEDARKLVEKFRAAGFDTRAVDIHGEPAHDSNYIMDAPAESSEVTRDGVTVRRMPNKRSWVFHFPAPFPYQSVTGASADDVINEVLLNPVYKPFADSLKPPEPEPEPVVEPPTPARVFNHQLIKPDHTDPKYRCKACWLHRQNQVWSYSDLYRAWWA
jgi:hypothetical protein